MLTHCQTKMTGLLFIIATLFLIEDGYAQVQQPGNIVRGEGEKGIHVSCEIYAFNEQVPFWRINDVDYISCNLPPPYTQTPSGLEIDIATRDMDGTTFQCLLLSQDDLSVQKSHIGVLTVTRGSGNSNTTVEEEHYIEIDHKSIDLNEEDFTLSWRTNILNQSCNIVLVTFTHLCETMAFQKNTINVDERNVTLPVVYFYSEAGEPSVIDISVQNEHQDACPGLRLKEPVRFDVDHIEVLEIPLESGNYNRYCVNISSSTFILAISYTPRDIFCPIYIEEESDCYNVNRCFGFIEAFGSPFFSVCKYHPANSSSLNFQLCFMRVSQILDGIKIFFLTLSRPCARSPLSTKLYTRAIQIQVKDCICDFVQEPEDITAMEGARYFFIACKTCENESRSLIWQINGTNYTELDLPVFYIPSPSGLFIDHVDLSMNGTTFQCILPTENDSIMQISSLGVLTVDIASDPILIQIFEFDLIALNINSDNITLAWRGLYRSNENCTNSYFILEWSPLFACDDSQSKVYNSSDGSIILPLHTSNGKDVKFNISIQECPVSTVNPLPATFNFDYFESITVPFGFNNCSCINVTKRSFLLIISTIFGDVQCTVGIIGPGESCYNFSEECMEFSKAFNATKPFLSICRYLSGSSDPYQMCFGNITKELNNIRIYITSTIFIPCEDIRRRLVRQYFQAIEIQVQANVMLTSNEVCVYPPTNSCSTFPKGNNLGVSIRDISGYSVFNGNITIGTCREVDSQQLAIASCAPFQVTLNDMESTLHNIPQDSVNEQESNLCRCLEENVKINFQRPTISKESFNLSIQYNCTTPYNPPSDVEISVIFTVDSDIGQLSGCKNGSMSVIDVKNSCKMRNELLINVTKIFERQNCNNSIKPIPVKCPEQQTDNQQQLLFLLFLPILLFMALTVICCMLLYKWYQGRNHSYTPPQVGSKKRTPMKLKDVDSQSSKPNDSEARNTPQDQLKNEDKKTTVDGERNRSSNGDGSGDQNQPPAAGHAENLTEGEYLLLKDEKDTGNVENQQDDQDLHPVTPGPSDTENEAIHKLSGKEDTPEEDQLTKQIGIEEAVNQPAVNVLENPESDKQSGDGKQH